MPRVRGCGFSGRILPESWKLGILGVLITMIWAEVHGKLGSDLWRSEDALTSTAFGLLRYLPARLGILKLLRIARPVTSEGVLAPSPDWIDTSAADAFEITPWCRLGNADEPDILIDLNFEGRVAHRIIIEVKLHSGKSGLAADGEADQSSCEDAKLPPSDQLRKYWWGLCQLCRCDEPPSKCSLIYLTAHQAPPEKELTESYAPSMRLAWLSWRDVWQVATDAAKATYSDASPCRMIAEDLAKLLHHKGLSAFTGFGTVSPALPDSLHFWRTHGGTWFKCAPPVVPITSLRPKYEWFSHRLSPLVNPSPTSFWREHD
jgi:hypothetical protein